MSAKTGLAPQARTTLAVASKVNAGTITSSPGPIPYATSEVWSAAVPEFTAMACFVPTFALSFPSNSFTNFPPS